MTLVAALPAVLTAPACRPGDAEQRPRTLEARLVHDSAHRRCVSPEGAGGPSLVRCGLAPSEEQRRSLALQLERLPAAGLEGGLRRAVLLTRLSPHGAGVRSAAAGLEPIDPDAGAGRAALAQSALEHAAAVERGEPARLLTALELADRAVAGEPDRPAGHFNRGLILEDLGLCRLAHEAFETAVGLERDPAWAAETAARLRALPCAGGLAPGQPGRAVESALDAMIQRWAESAPATPWEAIAEDLEAVPEDGRRLLAAASRELAEAPDDPRRRAAVAALAEGRSRFSTHDFAAAYRNLGRALPDLEADGGVLAAWCRFWLAAAALYEERHEEARNLLRPLDGAASSRTPGLALVAGRAAWSTGLAHLREGDLGAALDRFTAARGRFEDAGYEDLVGTVRTLEAETLSALGLIRESWVPRSLALHALQTPHPRYHLHNALIEGALTSERQGLRSATDALLEEAGRVAPKLGETALIEVLLRQGDVAERRGDASRARKSYQHARRSIVGLPAGRLRERLVSRAELGLRSLDPPGGEGDPADLDRLVQRFAEDGPRWRQLAALSLKARRFRERDRLGEALAVLDDAAAVIRAQQGPLAGGPFGSRYSESVRSIFDQRIELALAQDDGWHALELLEESRYLGTGAGVSLARPDSGDPRVFLVFGELADSIAWWRIDRGLLTFGRLDEEDRAALHAAATHPEVLERDPGPASAALLGPVLDGVAPDRPLVVVPDGAVHRLPIRALRNPATGVRLIGERPMTFFLTLADALTPPPPPRPRPRAVVVAPGTGGRALPWLPPLPGALEEAGRVTDLYPGAVSLTGPAATRARVREATVEVDVLHVATHTLLAERPEQDRLVLAGDAASDALVAAHELIGKGTTPQLVVLAGCSTLGDATVRAGGPSGLVGTFTRHGVAATLSTYWPVEDGGLTGLTLAFHRHWLGGLPAGEALRRAQLEAIAEGEPVRTWAALQLFGDAPSPGTSPSGGTEP